MSAPAQLRDPTAAESQAVAVLIAEVVTFVRSRTDNVCLAATACAAAAGYLAARYAVDPTTGLAAAHSVVDQVFAGEHAERLRHDGAHGELAS